MVTSKRVTSKRSAEKESFWRLVLDEHRRSGLTVRAFCQKEGISEPSFYGWRKEIKRRDGDPVADATVQQQRLIPVDIVDAAGEFLPRCAKAPSAPLEVVTPSGFTLRFHQDIEPQQLNALLSVVAGCQDGAVRC